MQPIIKLCLTFILTTYLTPAQATMTYALNCNLTETNDNFIYFPEQLIYYSDQFAVFHNFKGRVVTQVDLKTDQMVRTTYIGEPFDPQYQILFGECRNALSMIELWENERLSTNPTL
ncbi:hypothetical protein [Vibrio sp. WXL210]|uniref:hypothetical protein n=1 Tax=Vibrio sp. WXL210 TaxID=3450709 RepID=UPI003EC5EDCA